MDSQNPRVVLAVVAGSRRGVTRALREDTILGRGSLASAFAIGPLDRAVSRGHARVSFERDAVWIEDLGSHAGTFVNEKRIEGRRRLLVGDVIRLGALTAPGCVVLVVTDDTGVAS